MRKTKPNIQSFNVPSILMNITIELGKIPLFQAVPAPILTLIAQESYVYQVAKGTILFHQGTQVTGFYYVVRGSVKLSVNSVDGHEKIIEIIHRGMSFGEAMMFIDQPYPVTAEALAETQVLHISHSLVVQLVQENSEFALKMLAGLSWRLHALVRDMQHLCLHSATQRVLGFLISECGCQPLRHTSPITLSLPASKKTIAARLNVTPETFSRILRQLSEKKLLSVKGKMIIIHDVNKIRQLEQCAE